MMILSTSLLAGALLLSSWRVVRGPSLEDRVVGLEVFTLSILAAILLHALETGEEVYLDMALLWSLLTFLATSALGLYLAGENRG